MRTGAALAFLILTASLGAAPRPAMTVGSDFRELPWGIADAAGKFGYLTKDKGQVEAVDLGTGKVKWTSTEKGKPLALVKGQVAIQVPHPKKKNVVRVLFLDAGGKKVKESQPLAFPDWTVTGPEHGRHFASAAWNDDSHLYVHWSAEAWYAGAARPTPELEKAARKKADGVARIVIATGKVTMLQTKEAPKPPAPKVSAAIAKAAGRQVWTPLGTRLQVSVSDKYAVLITPERAGLNQKVKMDRWDLKTGKKQETVELIVGRLLRYELSADAATVLVCQLGNLSSPQRWGNWSAFSTETGKKLSAFDKPSGLPTVSALGSRAYLVLEGPGKGIAAGRELRSRTLRAIDLKSGKKVWERSLEGRVIPVPPK